MKIFQFGEQVEGYQIPVLNEREVRAAAGLFFVGLLIAVTQIVYLNRFTMLKVAVVVFFVDFAIRVLVNPRFAPSMILGRFIVKNQTPEYVGAPQKKFAWMIGLTLAVVMFVHMVVLNAYSPITALSCLFCLIFLFFESIFGICLGCKVYHWVYKKKAMYCPGEVCELKARQEIQKISRAQVFMLVATLALIVLAVVAFRENLRVAPHDLFGKRPPSATK